MVIASETIDALRNRKLRDSGLAKQYTMVQLQAKLAALDPQPEFVYPPFKHQLVTFLLCVRNPRYFLMLDMGTGKTKVMLDVFRYRRQLGQCHRMLVLVPNTSMLETWETEAAKHAPDLKVATLHRKMRAADREVALFNDGDVLVCTYKGFTKLMSRPSKGRKKHEPDPAKIRACAQAFDFLVPDESSALGSWDSQIFRIFRALAPKIPNMYNLTGTPFNGDAQRLWPQFFLLDRGATLGSTLGLFRAVFFREVELPFATVWRLPKRGEPELHRVCKHGSIRYEETECEDLPPVVGGIESPQIRWVDQTTEQVRHTIALEKEIETAHKQEKRVDGLYYKMRCVAAGYCSIGDKEFADFSTNPRIDELLSLLSELGSRQVIVFFYYQHTGELLAAALKKAKVQHVVAGKTTNIPAAIAKFRKGTRVLLASVSSVSMGLNLQFCRVAVYAESPDDIVKRRQSEKRIDRPGGDGTAFIYDICVRGTVDGKVIKSLQENKRVLDVVVDG